MTELLAGVDLMVFCLPERKCGTPFEYRRNQRMSLRFCSDRCRYRNRDRRRYAEDPERERAKSRPYYAANREQVLGRAKARRAKRA